MTVAQNVAYGLRRRNVEAAARDARVTEMLGLVRLAGLEARRHAALSGGQQQRVALARALAINPRLLLLDEPLSNLDARLRETLRTELGAILRAVGTTTLVVTHDQEEAMALADRIAVMNQGRILQVGTAQALYDTPANRFVAEFVGRMVWFDGVANGDVFRSTEGIVLRCVPAQRVASAYGIAIRPERIRIGRGEEGANRIAGHVAGIAFRGAEFIVSVALAGGRVIDVPCGRDSALPAPGNAVTVHVLPAHCRVTAATEL